MNRTEHLDWCKTRALEYLPADPNQAFTSMMSDLGKHDGTRNHVAIALGMNLLMGGKLENHVKMRYFITGFN